MILRKKKKVDGIKTILKLGHREYVGGMWEHLGQLQFEFLLDMGLKNTDSILDIGCGCLRGGRHLIEYLDPCNYHGIEKEEALLIAGIYEIGINTFLEKLPVLYCNDKFDFHTIAEESVSWPPKFSIAFSLLTHLNKKDILILFKNLSEVVSPGHIFYATFNQGKSTNPLKSSNFSRFEYSLEDIEWFGSSFGFEVKPVHGFNHPRGQKMLEFKYTGKILEEL